MQISIGPAHLHVPNQTNSNSNSSIASVNVNLTNNQQSVSMSSLTNANASNNSSNSNNPIGLISASANLLSASARVEQMATQAAVQAATNVAIRHIMHNQIYPNQHQSHHLNTLSVPGLFSNNMNNPNSNLLNSHPPAHHQLPPNLQTAYRSHLPGQSPIIHFPMVPYMPRIPRIHFLDRLDRSLEVNLSFNNKILLRKY